MKVRVADEAECEAADAVVCCRVADLPPIDLLPLDLREYAKLVRERSAREPCRDCGEIVLVDVHSPRRPPRLCVECVGHRIEAEGRVQ